MQLGEVIGVASFITLPQEQTQQSRLRFIFVKPSQLFSFVKPRLI